MLSSSISGFKSCYILGTYSCLYFVTNTFSSTSFWIAYSLFLCFS